MNFQTDRTEQAELFAFSHRDLVGPESDTWLYMDLFDQLNLSAFNQIYSYQGQAAKEPRLMLRTIFYGLTHGVVSGRRLEDACRNDNRYVVLSGNLRPDRRTIDRFLERHESHLVDLFAQIVRLAQTMGLVSLGRVAIDGSRFKGNTGSTHSMQYEKMKRAMGYIEAELNQLREDLKKAQATESSRIEDRIPKEIQKKEIRLEKIRAAKEQIEKEHQSRTKKPKNKPDLPNPETRKSLHDPEALSLADRSGRHQFGYNAQIAVDEKSQIIVACDIHDKATDYEAMPIILEQVKEHCGANAQNVLADLGYKSAENIHFIESSGAKSIIALGKDSKGNEPQSPSSEIHFCEQVKQKAPSGFECMAGKRLPINKMTDALIEFSIRAGFCEGCVFASTCKGYFSEPAKPKGRQNRKSVGIPSDRLRESYTNYIRRTRDTDFAENYRRRKSIVEPVFGNIKNKGIRILVTGKIKVHKWWKMACTAHNIEKIIRATAQVSAT